MFFITITGIMNVETVEKHSWDLKEIKFKVRFHKKHVLTLKMWYKVLNPILMFKSF